MRWRGNLRTGALAVSLCLISLPAGAWDEADHVTMTDRALADVAADWGLTRPCPVRPLQSFLDKLKDNRPELGDPWHFADSLQINPKVDLEASAPSLKGRRSVTPLEILSNYSIDPDDGRDQDLFVRDEKGRPRRFTPDQRWFGPIQGADSQAFRHIEKPPFSWRHPWDTFGFPFRAVGEASRRAEIYFQTSETAFSLGEEYWGWRFLANALHYIEDLHNPYHAGQITPRLIAQGIGILLRGGWSQKGFVGSFAEAVSRSHHFFESWLARDLEKDLKETVIGAAEGTDAPVLTSSVQGLAVEIRDQSNRFFSELVSHVARGPADNATKMRMVEIARDRWGSAGRAIRTVVRASITQQKTAGPADQPTSL